MSVYRRGDFIMEQSIVKTFKHRSFEERLAEYNGEISVCDFDWGELDDISDAIQEVSEYDYKGESE
jgi:hypothetical protein